MNSLSTRITLSVALLLALCGLAAGVAFHRALRHAAEAELRGRLDVRLEWLRGAIDAELDDGQIQLRPRDEPTGAAEWWEVADAATGRVLWTSGGYAPGQRVVAQTYRQSFGPPDARPVAAAGLVPEDDETAKPRTGWEPVAVTALPPAVSDAARAGRPGLEIREAWARTRVKKKDRDAPRLYELRGRAGGKEHEIRVDAAGAVQSIKDRDVRRFGDYRFDTGDDDRRLDLLLTARASTAPMEAELAATARLLWTVGPLALLLTAALLALAIRWQLRPLARMAGQAAGIGPADLAGAGDRVVGPAGTSAELVRLRDAINTMLARLATALQRERRFAATAAHELRTPLAQMRVTLEVALRRDRPADEYRQALQDISSDIDRLQRLIVGLLQLARSSDATAGPAGRPLALGPLLEAAARTHGPARLDGPADGIWVFGDPDLLVSAVGNVLENAARYAPGEPPALRVEPSAGGEDAGTVAVVVADRGPGIAEADRERVFEPLTRLNPPAGAPEGFGLGLAVARGAVRGFGGDLTCRPRADGAPGTEFVFRLRRAAAPDDQ